MTSSIARGINKDTYTKEYYLKKVVGVVIFFCIFPMLVSWIWPKPYLPSQSIDTQSNEEATDTEAGSSSEFEAPEITVNEVERFLQVIAYNESRGNPLADAPGSSATGKYQYTYGTWNGVPGQENGAKYLFPPAIEYAEARDAPEAVQDAVAYIEYSQKFRDLDRDLFSLAISHFYPRALTHPEYLDRIIGSNTITPREYANMLIEGIRSGAGQDIPLNYRSAPNFDQYAAEAGIEI